MSKNPKISKISKSSKISESSEFSDVTDAERLAVCVIVLSLKGGVGKSLIALLIAWILGERGCTPTFVSIDRMHPVERFGRGFRLHLVDLPSERAIEEDPLAVLRTFSVITRAVREAAGGPVVIDLGSPAARHLLTFAHESLLAARLAALGYRVVFALPYTHQDESVIGAAQPAALVPRVFPEAEMLVIENRLARRAPNPASGSEVAAALDQLRAAGPHVVVPQIPDYADRYLAAGVRLDEAPLLDEEERQAILDEDEDMTTIVTLRLETWLLQLRKHLSRGLGLDA